MNYIGLKEEIKEILRIVDLVPAELKTKCFEILLNNFLSSIDIPKEKVIQEKGKYQQSNSTFEIPPLIKSFMRKHNITQEEFESIIMIENNEVYFIKEPNHNSSLRGQNEWALLIALKNGLLSNNLKADPEDVRSIIQEKGFYDSANFSKNFKNQKYSGYFKVSLIPQGSAQPLTKEGENALAELIKSLIKD